MNTLFLILIITNILLFIGVLVVWQKFTKPPQEDPRLSKGLQLLQSKISILEDLSDRTDVQIKQLMTLLEQKIKQVQQKIHDSEHQMQKIEQSMLKSLEVAEIFQDKIPHEEIIERQNSVKYIQAAQMAYQGHSVDEIVEVVDLPKGEVEFIVKVNKDELMFDMDNLPDWAKKSLNSFGQDNSSSDFIIENFKSNSADISQFEAPNPNLESLKRLENEFKSACSEHDQAAAEYEHKKQQPSEIARVAKKVTYNITETASDWLHDSKNMINERLEKQNKISSYDFETKQKKPLESGKSSFKLKDVFSQSEKILSRSNTNINSSKNISADDNKSLDKKNSFEIKNVDLKPLVKQEGHDEGPST